MAPFSLSSSLTTTTIMHSQKKDAARARTAAARAAAIQKRAQARGGEEVSGGTSDPPGDQPYVPPGGQSSQPGGVAGGRAMDVEGGSQPLHTTGPVAGTGVENEEESEDDVPPPNPGAKAEMAKKVQAFLEGSLAELNAAVAEEEEEDEEEEDDDDDDVRVVRVRPRTPEPALKRDFECLRCVHSALHGDSSGWCVPASGARTRKCQRCATGKTPCLVIREGSELRRLARAFLDAKRGNVRPRDLSRAKFALRSRLEFEESLPEGDPQLSTQRSGEVAGVAPIPPSGGDAVVRAPVVGASSGG
ncbi:hypothetical protein CI238_13472, partial [Colletotrichum incanum]